MPGNGSQNKLITINREIRQSQQTTSLLQSLRERYEAEWGVCLCERGDGRIETGLAVGPVSIY